MPTYSTLDSPSLRKMEGYKRDSFGKKKRFSMGNIFGDPFALATISVGIMAWLIAFVSSVIAVVQTNAFPNYSWWTLVFTFFAIIGVTISVASDAVQTYQVAIVGFLSAGLVFTTSSVNSLIYLPNGARAHDAASAGFILLSMVAIVWIFYYGSQPTASHRHAIDSLALHKEGRAPSRTSRHMANSTYRPETTISQQPQMYTSAQLSGFETSSPVTGYPGGAIGQSDNKRNSEARFGQPAPTQQPQPTSAQQTRSVTPAQAAPAAAPAAQENNNSPTEYPYRAKAIYSYEANPEDPNEISFSKHEILEVSDVSGRWWQAKKESGETGIAPSNYLILL
ncbi:putative high osmolarity signaling protein sho1 [Elsinoe fawcettii]|nr:putative high osmolarity signaling protein sho1 [Elsinoe fawcettii]